MDKTDKLLGKVDALLGKHHPAASKSSADIPMLTDVVQPTGTTSAGVASMTETVITTIAPDTLREALQNVYLSIDQIVDTKALSGAIAAEAEIAAQRISDQIVVALKLEITKIVKRHLNNILTEASELELLRLEGSDSAPDKKTSS